MSWTPFQFDFCSPSAGWKNYSVNKKAMFCFYLATSSFQPSLQKVFMEEFYSVYIPRSFATPLRRAFWLFLYCLQHTLQFRSTFGGSSWSFCSAGLGEGHHYFNVLSDALWGQKRLDSTSLWLLISIMIASHWNLLVVSSLFGRSKSKAQHSDNPEAFARRGYGAA